MSSHQLDLPYILTARPELAPPDTPVPPGGALLVCVLVPDPRRRGKMRARLRRAEDGDKPGALNVAGPRVRMSGLRYLVERLVLIPETDSHAAYWRAVGELRLIGG